MPNFLSFFFNFLHSIQCLHCPKSIDEYHSFKFHLNCTRRHIHRDTQTNTHRQSGNRQSKEIDLITQKLIGLFSGIWIVKSFCFHVAFVVFFFRSFWSLLAPCSWYYFVFFAFLFNKKRNCHGSTPSTNKIPHASSDSILCVFTKFNEHFEWIRFTVQTTTHRFHSNICLFT